MGISESEMRAAATRRWVKQRGTRKLSGLPNDRKIVNLLRNEQPLSFTQIGKKLDLVDQTLNDNLKKLKEWGEIKQLDDGRYCLIDYMPEEGKNKKNY